MGIGDGGGDFKTADPADVDYEDGQVLIPRAAVPPPGVTLTAFGPTYDFVSESFSALNGATVVTDYDDLINGGTGDDTGVVCFVAGTVILTDAGEMPVERLRPGTKIATYDNGQQPFAMLASYRPDAADLARHPELKPIEIKPGALGAKRCLLVSSQHMMLVRQNGGEAFVRARQLSRMDGGGVRVMNGCRQVTYFTLFSRPTRSCSPTGVRQKASSPAPVRWPRLAPLRLDRRAGRHPEQCASEGGYAPKQPPALCNPTHIRTDGRATVQDTSEKPLSRDKNLFVPSAKLGLSTVILLIATAAHIPQRRVFQLGTPRLADLIQCYRGSYHLLTMTPGEQIAEKSLGVRGPLLPVCQQR